MYDQEDFYRERKYIQAEGHIYIVIYRFIRRKINKRLDIAKHMLYNIIKRNKK